MLRPEFLKKGDKIAIVATARKINKKEISQAISLLQNWGLVVVLGKTIEAENHQFAGKDADRIADFQKALDTRDIKAIWSARGGYGTVRIIDHIDFDSFMQQPKWIIGYSDITVLHSHIHTLGIATLHAPMPIDICKGTRLSIESLKETLFGKSKQISIDSHPNNRSGVASGMLVGGNLSILYSLCGSKSSIDTAGKILCIEDLDEYLYHIDRMLQNLKRNGYFDHVSGLIVGGMTKLHDNVIPFGYTVEEIILEAVKEFDFPVVFGFPVGHVKDNRALILGEEVSLVVNKLSVTLSSNI